MVHKIIICGPPASGKGTQCRMMKQQFGVIHISSGALLRAEKKKSSELGLKAKEYMDKGELVPDNLVIDIVKRRVSQPDCVKCGWLLDGFPRTKTQATALKEAGIFPTSFVLLDVPDAVLVERVVGRRMDPVTGKTYHMKFFPPESKKVKARLTRRTDDTEAKVQVRIGNYHKCITAIRGQYKEIEVIINGNQSKQVVFNEILSNLSRKPTPCVVKLVPKIIITGSRSSGKTTQCKRISAKFGVMYLHMRDVLNEHKIQAPVSASNAVISLKARLTRIDCVKKGWVLDGYPETSIEAEALCDVDIRADMLIVLQVDDSVASDRIVTARVDAVTGTSYVVKHHPPDTDATRIRKEKPKLHCCNIRLHTVPATCAVLMIVNRNTDANLVFQAICSYVSGLTPRSRM